MALAVVGVALTIVMYTKIGLLISAFLLVVVIIATAVGRPKDSQRQRLSEHTTEVRGDIMPPHDQHQREDCRARERSDQKPLQRFQPQQKGD